MVLEMIITMKSKGFLKKGLKIVTNTVNDPTKRVKDCLTFPKLCRGNTLGDRVGLPSMWPGFDFRSRCHMWIEFVGSLLCHERFSPGYSGFPLSSKTNI